MKTITHNIGAFTLALAIIVASAVYLIKPVIPAMGAAFTGQAAFIQIATSTSVSSGSNTRIFADNPNCKSRVIGTQGLSAVMLIFDDNTTNYLSSTTLSGAVGFVQAASTTVAYDSGIYGCGEVYVRPYVTQTLTLSEF